MIIQTLCFRSFTVKFVTCLSPKFTLIYQPLLWYRIWGLIGSRIWPFERLSWNVYNISCFRVMLRKLHNVSYRSEQLIIFSFFYFSILSLEFYVVVSYLLLDEWTYSAFKLYCLFLLLDLFDTRVNRVFGSEGVADFSLVTIHCVTHFIIFIICYSVSISV
jgi:hypothetical protein